ncbi:MAG: hypothetical protein ACTHXA_10865 [Gulosibacter sp.]|uniref:hypothetical protein n=1 Tax=Gulosibacter sp. TaxID=2817531 RepID=UPI003F90E8BF
MSKPKKFVRTIGKALPTRIRKGVKRVAKKVLPQRAQSTVAPVSDSTSNAQAQPPLDPLSLAAQPTGASDKGRQQPIAGRAAAGTTLDPEASARLGRAMFGHAAPARTAQGGRPVAGIFASDLRDALCTAGHEVSEFVPGITGALADSAEVLVIDLAGFTGVWDGALEPTGVSLIREVTDAVEAARYRGVTCWLVVRGDQPHYHGAILLQESTLLQPLLPGQQSTEQTHFTENPGNAPVGIVDIIRSLEVAA